MASERVTITRPTEVVESIDPFERNRSRFRSIANPRPEASKLVDLDAGKAVRGSEGSGWVEE